MVWLTVISLLTVVCEVIADYCGDSIFCDAPYKCCEMRKGCCYDSMLHSSKHFRLQIWNMWYFWFLIIFMMMSCFGGCGYYRRRRLAMLTRSSSPPPLRPTTVLEPTQRRSRVINNDGNARQLNFFAYIGPGVGLPQPVSNMPPAYAEVVNHPGLYPFNKMELPPYPGNDKPEDGHFGYAPPSPSMLLHETSLPPPYSEYTYGSPPVPGDISSQHTPSQGDVEQLPVERTGDNAAVSTTFGRNH